MSTIAVIGGGFSGTLLSLHLLRRCPPDTRIVLIERDRFGGGPAYSTGNPHHLLNVPAGAMSAFHDRPNDFLEWAQAQPPEPGCDPPSATCFVSRRSYGNYIRHLLSQELRDPDAPNVLELLRGDAVRLLDRPDGLCVELADGRTLETDYAVLAIGNFPPEPPHIADPSFYDGPLYRGDCWAPDALDDLPPDAPVLLIGTGLTMVDLAISLQDRDHRGTLHALSRHGLLPRRHGGGKPPASGIPAFPTAVLPLLRALRRDARQALAAGGGWQGTIDQLRPFTADLWRGFSEADRRCFLRHLRRWWDVHRHRLAPLVAERIDAARADGRLVIHAGHVRAIDAVHGMAVARYAPRGGGQIQTITAARVINCAGPGADYARIRHPLVRDLLQAGMVRPDALRLGLDVTAGNATIDGSGCVSRRIFAAGPVTRGMHWEITAVPDIRRQCELLATTLATLVRTAPAIRPE